MWYVDLDVDDFWPSQQDHADPDPGSGIFGYINYLVEKDRGCILDTLVNGKPDPWFD